MAITNSRRWPFSFFSPFIFFVVVHYWILDKCLSISGVNCAVLSYILFRLIAPPPSIFFSGRLFVLCRIVNFLCSFLLTLDLTRSHSRAGPKSRFSIYFTRKNEPKKKQNKTNEISFLRNVAALPQQRNFKMTNTLTVWACINILLCIYNKQRKKLINLT